MQVHQVQPNAWIGYLVTAVIVIAILAFRMRGMRRMQPLKLERLWVVPAIYLFVVGSLFAQYPPTSTGWTACVAALLVGAVLGWQRGKLMRIQVDPQTHQLNQQASFAGIAFIVVLIVLKTAARSEGEAFHLDVGMLTDALGTLALGMFGAQRLEMYLRARRLLAAARA